MLGGWPLDKVANEATQSDSPLWLGKIMGAAGSDYVTRCY